MDYLTQPWVRERLRQVIAGADRFVILELTGVSFCDSAGLSVLLWARGEAEAHGVVLVLACVPASLRCVLQMTGADQVLRVFDTVVDAQGLLGG
jgi:anti-anti-sigma factor